MYSRRRILECFNGRVKDRVLMKESDGLLKRSTIADDLKMAEQTNIPSAILNSEQGLSDLEVEQRKKAGLINKTKDFTERKISHIVMKNVFSLFNVLHIAIAASLFYVGSYKNTLFLGVVFCNMIIGIVQEIGAKKILDKLLIVNQQNEVVIRNSRFTSVTSKELVKDDIIILRAGCNVSADCVIKYGKVEVNEAMITGESDCVTKSEGEQLLSGSFITSDTCYAKVQNVGEESYINKLTKKARQYKKYNSEMIDAIRLVIKWISFVIIPLCGLLFWRQFSINSDLKLAVERTSAAMLSMIPEGLVLLTSVALTVGALKLASERVLVQELYGLENLAKIGVVCMDKTGTITQNKLKLDAIKPCSAQFLQKDIDIVLASIVSKLNDVSNKTFSVLKDYVEENEVEPLKEPATNVVKFSSARKWSGVEFKNKESFILGAPEVILKSRYGEFKTEVEKAIADGNRVVLLAHTQQKLEEIDFEKTVTPIALLILSDLIRERAQQVISLLQERDARIKILSGDNPLAVSKIAKKVGILDYENYIDASTLKDNEELKEAAFKYAIFGRVSPDQKQELVNILKEKTTVAMIGDGINDILALKHADCSIALGSGSSAARQVAQIVLLNDDFSMISNIIFEGQRIINNIQRSGSMFLSKTFFAILLTFILLFWAQSYPLEPIQLTLINTFTVGLPSFVLSFEKSRGLAEGGFLRNIIVKSLPSAVVMVLNIIVINIIGNIVDLTSKEISTLSAFSVAVVNLLLLHYISLPLDKLRKRLWLAMIAAFLACSTGFRATFEFEYSFKIFVILIPLCIATYKLFNFMHKATDKILKRKCEKS